MKEEFTRISEALGRFNNLQSELESLYHQASYRLGLSDSAMQILYMIYSEGGRCPLSTICRVTLMSKQTANSALRKLEREGAVYLEGYVGRRKLVCLTDEGMALAGRTAAVLIDIDNRILGGWTEEERAVYFRLMQSYISSFRDEINKL